MNRTILTASILLLTTGLLTAKALNDYNKAFKQELKQVKEKNDDLKSEIDYLNVKHKKDIMLLLNNRKDIKLSVQSIEGDYDYTVCATFKGTQYGEDGGCYFLLYEHDDKIIAEFRMEQLKKELNLTGE